MKRLSLVTLRRIYTIAALATLGLLFAFLSYLYTAFNNALIGDLQTELTPDLLTGLQTKKIENAVLRLEHRAGLPDIPKELSNPFQPPSAR